MADGPRSRLAALVCRYAALLCTASLVAAGLYPVWSPAVDARSGIPAVQEAGQPVVRGALRAEGRAFVYPDGSRFRWRGVTAFALLDQVARGRESDARAFLDWARATGFTVVRVLAMADGLFTLRPEQGRAALPRLLELVREADLYVELVALSDTRRYPRLDLREHVRLVGGLCASVDHCLLEVANEPWHPTHVADLTPARLAGLAGEIPGRVLVALGAAATDGSREMALAPADYLTVHRARGGPLWPMVGRLRTLGRLSEATGLPVVDDEPDGFGEREDVIRVDGRPYRRQVRAELAFATGAVSRVFDVGSTFHCESCLTAVVPGPVQQAAAAAFVEGTRLVPDGVVPAFRPVGVPGAPVAAFRAAGDKPRDGAAVAVFSGLTDEASGLVVLLGVHGEPRVTWGGGWRQGAVLAERPGVRVVAAIRDPSRRP